MGMWMVVPGIWDAGTLVTQCSLDPEHSHQLSCQKTASNW